LGTENSALIPMPSYEHFVLNADASGAKITKFYQNNFFENSLDELISKIEFTKPDLAYLVSPNNPTGTIWT
jgi:histidinol-phosphate/aromatic aminotransferase/cobyric acid decarboxylase-like protein